jgi:hypothetical protein
MRKSRQYWSAPVPGAATSARANALNSAHVRPTFHPAVAGKVNTPPCPSNARTRECVEFPPCYFSAPPCCARGRAHSEKTEGWVPDRPECGRPRPQRCASERETWQRMTRLNVRVLLRPGRAHSEKTKGRVPDRPECGRPRPQRCANEREIWRRVTRLNVRELLRPGRAHSERAKGKREVAVTLCRTGGPIPKQVKRLRDIGAKRLNATITRRRAEFCPSNQQQYDSVVSRINTKYADRLRMKGIL